MRPEHAPDGDPCSRCGLAAFRHRNRTAKRAAYRAAYDKARPKRHWKEKVGSHRKPHPKRLERIVFIDGEGQGRSPHKYTYLAACDEHGKVWDVEDKDGLTTRACLEFFLSLPTLSLTVGYALGYDFTKILADLPDKTLYDLFHEHTRRYICEGRIQYRAVNYQGYRINYMNRRLTIVRGKKRKTIWDIFRFFQGKFTSALIDWKVADKDKLTRMADMKDKRSEFDRLDFNDIKAYCQEECLYGAKLARALIQAHLDAGLPLKTFFGAGSTATSFLNHIAIKDKRGEIPDAMGIPVACAFFGGRFENSHSGPIEGTVHDYDISSAYPYQTTFLPCLTHGTWRHVSSPRHTRAFANSTLALVHWRLPRSNVLRDTAWGPLPVRHESGTIAFPLAAKGGWCWKEEFEIARGLFPHLEMTESWLYDTDCDCTPFKDVPTYYLERLKLGKDAKGLVIKLGLNSIYGKLAQSAGVNPPFRSYVWAGNITSGTRSQLLTSFRGLADRSNILMFATDGVKSRVPLTLERPNDTGTAASGKPLGGWEHKVFDKGVFLVRPGIYFPLQPTDDELKEVKARGLGKKVLYEQWRAIEQAWHAGAESLRIAGMTRFQGIKSSFSKGEKSGIKRSVTYGEWIPHAIDVSFSPNPKREAFIDIGQKAKGLKTWDYLDWESVPYSPATVSPEAKALREFEDIALEQPDVDFGGLEGVQ